MNRAARVDRHLPSSDQLSRFQRDGYLLVEGVLEPAAGVDPLFAEYAEVLDRLARELHARGELASTYADLAFAERLIRIYRDTGRDHSRYFDPSLMTSGVTPETPFWAGPAVFRIITHERVLDLVECLIGPEIYSNPVQHIRIKPPERLLPDGATDVLARANPWHQDNGVVDPVADGTDMSTFNENRRASVIADPTRAPAAVADAPQAVAATDHPANASHTDPAPATDRASRDARDKQAPMGRAARDVEGRMLASAGLMTEAQPVFAAPAHGVAHGGVLAALPMLLRAGLLGAANRLFRLPNGFYGLTTILLFVACMTLARVRNPESLRYQAPGEWGAILGLDRCPETKTLRRKIRLLTSAEHTVRDWQSALARTWATEHEDDWATLAVDGHVKVYTGRNGRLPKHFVARQKLCMPASVSYWINALGGTPLLCLHKALDPKLVKAIEQDVVPHLLELGVVPEAPPDLTKPDADAPALTLVFDREGWSPDLFKRLARRGIACITWHKNFKGEDWPQEDFRTLEVPIHGPAGTSTTTVDLAEQPIVLRNGLTVRQIRRRLANGRQVPVITTHPQMPLIQVAGAMFSRWSQENFFKYMREQFNLDSLPTHDLEPLDPDAQVVNPVRRALEKTIRRVRSRLATARNRLAEALQEHHRDTATRLEADANALAAELDQLKQQRAHTLTHVRAGDLPEQDKLDALPVGGRLFLDLVRMIAYRAETRMMAPVITTQGKKPNARRLLRALLTSDANIIPLPAQGILRIQLLSLGSDACDRMLAPLVEELNATRTFYPGTDLRLVYELAGDPPPEVSPDSG